MRFKKPLSKKAAAKMDQISEVMFNETCNTVRLACILEKRVICSDCIAQRVMDRLPTFYEDKFEMMTKDAQEFMRQLVIWVASMAEYELKQPCEKENESE